MRRTGVTTAKEPPRCAQMQQQRFQVGEQQQVVTRTDLDPLFFFFSIFVNRKANSKNKEGEKIFISNWQVVLMLLLLSSYSASPP